jgi:thiamine biosynthesis lipoprotein
MVWKEMLKPHRLYPLVIVIAAILFWKYGPYKDLREQQQAQQEKLKGRVDYHGKTMGTTYKVLFYGDSNQVAQKEIDSILIAFNKVFSTYDPNSQLSELNKTGVLKSPHPWLVEVIQLSEEVYTNTNGYFDPTVKPLVNAWGFGAVDSVMGPNDQQLDSLLNLVGFDKVKYSDTLIELLPNMSLDFNAIAKGFGSDVVGEFLLSKGVNSYMVEIGGEVACGKRKPNGDEWILGIEKPIPEKRELLKKVFLQSEGMATSGDYRNIRQKGDQIFSHTIDPTSGKPILHELHSVSVVHARCVLADAYATAFMSMGLEKSKSLASELGLKTFFIYGNDLGNLKTIDLLEEPKL